MIIADELYYKKLGYSTAVNTKLNFTEFSQLTFPTCRVLK